MKALESGARMGFNYVVEVVRGGKVIDRESVHNLIPAEGLDHVMATVFKGGAQVPTWYLAIFEGNYTPTAGLTAAAFPATATECTAYTSGTRLEFVEGAVAAGSLDNSASKAEYTMNADKTVYGGVITSAAAKGATTGVLISAVRFATAKAVLAGDVLRVMATNTLAST